VVARTRASLRQHLGEAAFPIAVITLAVLLIPLWISQYQTPIYEASIKVLVGQGSTWPSKGEPSDSVLVHHTYKKERGRGYRCRPPPFSLESMPASHRPVMLRLASDGKAG
jgi:hypothetical protein